MEDEADPQNKPTQKMDSGDTVGDFWVTRANTFSFCYTLLSWVLGHLQPKGP